MSPFIPSKPRVTALDYRGVPGALLDLPGKRGAGIFVPRAHLTETIDQLCQIEEAPQQ